MSRAAGPPPVDTPLRHTASVPAPVTDSDASLPHAPQHALKETVCFHIT